jgi:hypothetical protein
MADNKKSGGYEIGYGKPPRHTRFKPGQSGNPRGRSKGTRNLKTDLAEELAERIAISEGGRRRAVSKQRGMLKQLMAKALKGDVRAANTVLGLVERLLDARADTDTALPAQDQAIISEFVRRHGGTPQAFDTSSGWEADAGPSESRSAEDGMSQKSE